MEDNSFDMYTDFIFSYNINEQVLNIFNKYQEYLCYKNTFFLIDSSDNKLEFQVLMLLENMGFSIIEVGTYLYVEVIMKVINMLNTFSKVECLYQNGSKRDYVVGIVENLKCNLLEDLNSLNSDFYFNLATRQDMQLSIFHSYINRAIPKVNQKPKNLLLNSNFTPKMELNYGVLAHNIANYIINCKDSELSLDDVYVTIPDKQKKKVKILL